MRTYKLTEQDSEAIIKLIRLSKPCINWKGKLKYIISEMLTAFRAKDAVFFSGTGVLKGIDWANSFSLHSDKSYLIQYSSYYRHLDPLYSTQFCPRPVKPVFKTDDIIPYSQMLKLEYYIDFLRPQDQLRELIMRFCSHEKFFGVISLQRSKNQPNFDDTNILKAKILVPHLINAFESDSLLSVIDEERKLLELWIESQPEGIIFLDYELRPLYCNSVARETCLSLWQRCRKPSEQFAGLGTRDFPIPREIVQDCVEFKRRLEDGRDFKYHYYNRIINVEHWRFYIEYHLICPSYRESSAPCFIICLRDWTKTGQTIGEVIDNSCGLTERECSIIQCVAEGLTNREIAERLCISRFTVETHLKNIFEKTGFKNRTQLANCMQSAWKFKIQQSLSRLDKSKQSEETTLNG
jgi:DNA-binding CsgD family transcriptional regulator